MGQPGSGFLDHLIPAIAHVPARTAPGARAAGGWTGAGITFVAIVLLIFYLLYLTVRVNGYARVVHLARSVAYLEKRVREAEARCAELSERLARPE